MERSEWEVGGTHGLRVKLVPESLSPAVPICLWGFLSSSSEDGQAVCSRSQIWQQRITGVCSLAHMCFDFGGEGRVATS